MIPIVEGGGYNRLFGEKVWVKEFMKGSYKNT
jgi:hypothetical protein